MPRDPRPPRRPDREQRRPGEGAIGETGPGPTRPGESDRFEGQATPSNGRLAERGPIDPLDRPPDEWWDDTPGAGEPEVDPDALLETGEFEPFEPGDPDEVEQPPARRRRGAATVTPAARRMWYVALALLVFATVVAVVPFLRSAAGAVVDGAGWVVGRAADGAGAVRDRWEGWTHELRNAAAGIPEAQIEEQRRLAGSESLLLVVTDGDRSTVAIALVARADTVEPSVVLVPPSIFEILPGYGDFSLSQATVFEGPELTSLALANVLGIRIDDVVEIGPGDLAAAVGGPIAVDLPVPLVVEDPDGVERVVAESGDVVRSAEVAEVLMVTQGTSERLEWVGRQAAVWEAVFRSMTGDAGVATRLASNAPVRVDEITGVLAATAAAEPQVTVVPVARVSVRGAEEGFRMPADESQDLVQRRLAHLELRDGPRPRIEILNGNGRVLATRAVAETLIRNGYHVINTDNAENFDFQDTLVVSQGRENRAAAEAIVKLLGVGDLLLELRAPSGVVDVSIIVGHDIPTGEV